MSSVRKTRSQSVTSKSGHSAVGKAGTAGSSLCLTSESLGRLFAELATIRATQESIVKDLDCIRESQTSLSTEIDAKYDRMWGEFKGFTSRLDDQEKVISDHTNSITIVESRLSKIEADLDAIKNTPVVSSNMQAASAAAQGSLTIDGLSEELCERVKRSRNVIVFGVDEPRADSAATRKLEDENYVTALFNTLEVHPVILRVFRLGRRKEAGGKRPMKVVCQSEEAVHNIIKNVRKLKNKREFVNVSVSYDRTPRQLAQYRVLKEEVKNRLDSGEKNLRIRYVSGTPKIVSLNRQIPTE